ncbi:MAG: hypothetical protein ACLT98_10875 [Eggerthellaceae bacterium]
MRFDVEAGAAAFDLKVPGASLMPSGVAGESGWVQAGSAIDAQAHRYALHLGLVLAAAAFDARLNPTRRMLARPCERGAELERQ